MEVHLHSQRGKDGVEKAAPSMARGFDDGHGAEAREVRVQRGEASDCGGGQRGLLGARERSGKGPEGDKVLLSRRMLGRGGKVVLGVAGKPLLLSSPLPCAPPFPSPPFTFATTCSAMVLATFAGALCSTGCAGCTLWAVGFSGS